MGRLPTVKKGAWTQEEDMLLRNCVEKYGEGKWKHVPERAGLNRCRKSCRLRWLNYLRPNIKRGNFAVDEVDLIIRLHKLLGNRWSLIAGRIPGRTANDIKNYWNCHLSKKIVSENKSTEPPTNQTDHVHGSTSNSDLSVGGCESQSIDPTQGKRQEGNSVAIVEEEETSSSFWRSLLVDEGELEKNRSSENKGTVLSDDSLFIDFEGLLQDMERWGNMGCLG